VVTCRGDEAPLEPHVADWLAQARGAAAVEEISLGPLPRTQVTEQVTALAGGPKAVAHLPGQQLVIGHARIVGPQPCVIDPGVDERAVPPI
jgi:hypothetical protein